FGYRYDGSDIIVSDGAPLPPDVANDYVPSASPGGRAPHIWLEDGASLYDKFGFEFTLLCLEGNADTAAFEKAAIDRGIPLAVLTIPNEDLRALYEADIALIRPDQVVVWRGDQIDNADQILTQVIGHATT
ncbi:MAG: hypothetical protein HON14_19295, partial [Rhodospirillaceae bacterium]|nr:hypothetical protein [Rhodospirillaceae bacterium]